MMEDAIFADLRRSIPKLKAREARKNSWILADTWRLVDKRVSARRGPAIYQALIQLLGHAINMGLKEDMTGRQRKRERR